MPIPVGLGEGDSGSSNDPVTFASRENTAISIQAELPLTPRPNEALEEEWKRQDVNMERCLKAFTTHLDSRLNEWHLKHQSWLQHELPLQLSMALPPSTSSPTRGFTPRGSPRGSPRGQCARPVKLLHQKSDFSQKSPDFGVLGSPQDVPCQTICDSLGAVSESERSDKNAQKTRQVSLARKLMHTNAEEAINKGRSCYELLRSGSYDMLLQHPYFKVTNCCLIIAYAIMLTIILEADCERGDYDDTGILFVMVELIFGFVFFPELLSRVLFAISYREDVCLFLRRPWNLFDAVMLCFQIVDFLFLIYTSGYTVKSGATGLRSAMMIFRVGRVVRVIRFVPRLEASAKFIWLSFWSVKWLLLAMLHFMFVGAVILTSIVFQHLHDEAGDVDDLRVLKRYFGNLPTTIYTLYLSISNGIHAKSILDALFAVQPFLAIVYVAFMGVVSLLILNVCTAIMLEKVSTECSQDRETMLAQQRSKLEAICLKLLDALQSVDEEEDGSNIGLDELLDAAEDAHVSQYIKALQIGSDDTRKIVQVLGRDRKGGVGAQDFVNGCLKVKSGMRNADLHFLLFESQVENKRIHKEIRREVRESTEQVRHQMRLLLMRMLNGSPPPPSLNHSALTEAHSAPGDWPFEEGIAHYVSPFSPRRSNPIGQEEVRVPPDMHDVPWMKSLPKGLTTPRDSPRCSPRENSQKSQNSPGYSI